MNRRVSVGFGYLRWLRAGFDVLGTRVLVVEVGVWWLMLRGCAESVCFSDCDWVSSVGMKLERVSRW